MKTFTKKLTNANVVLTAYTHDRSREMPNTDIRPAVLVFPGGGYMFCSDREADPIALAYLAEGYNAFILRYSVGMNVPATDAFIDAEEAISYLHENAEELSIDKEKIAVVGFSAGGHLAAWLCTHGKIKPTAAVLGYACILPEVGRLLGKELPDICEKVSSSTPPAFLFTTRDDTIVPVRHTLRYADALDKAGVPFEMHVFGKGVHGLSLAKSFTSSGRASCVSPSVAQWLGLSADWLKTILGDFAFQEEVEQLYDGPVDCATPLSILMNDEKARELTLLILPQIAEIIKQAEESGQTEIISAASIRQLARVRPELLEKANVEELDGQLKAL